MVQIMGVCVVCQLLNCNPMSALKENTKMMGIEGQVSLTPKVSSIPPATLLDGTFEYPQQVPVTQTFGVSSVVWICL